MDKNLEGLKKVNKTYTDTSAKLDIALCYIVPILEEFEKQITELEKKPTLTLGEIVKEIKRQGFEDPKRYKKKGG